MTSINLLVFTGLLLAAGGLGDRFGRKRALIVGLIAFGATSALAGSAQDSTTLIVARALMGIGAALIYPATLALLTSVFTVAKERAAAIGIWSTVSGLAVAAGPITRGWLLEHYWWESVFFVNLPVVAVAIAAAIWLVPESKDRPAPKLDLLGLLLSVAAIGTLVFTIIEAPEWGWASASSARGFLASLTLLAAFIRWELSVAEPMLPVRIFTNLRRRSRALRRARTG